MDAKSVASQLKSSGLLRTQGLIGRKWTAACDGKTIELPNCVTPVEILGVPEIGVVAAGDNPALLPPRVVVVLLLMLRIIILLVLVGPIAATPVLQPLLLIVVVVQRREIV
ncbi:hypothetical protein L484_019060 [Morus notabilis]|uniref:Uncharacterized protein n=1 Tax=Morus notabilis TaxID=981085 RepID=W9SFQ6_9ROSA|nr:hypothetical protein L484_019060 [Morus notabilis]